jgi:hypothetical protein
LLQEAHPGNLGQEIYVKPQNGEKVALSNNKVRSWLCLAPVLLACSHIFCHLYPYIFCNRKSDYTTKVYLPGYQAGFLWLLLLLVVVLISIINNNPDLKSDNDGNKAKKKKVTTS